MSYRIEVPERAHELSGIDAYDYADAFAVDEVVTPTPRQWFEEFFGPRTHLVPLVKLVHGRILGMRLDGPPESYGWRVERETESVAVLAAEGRLMTARIAAYSTTDRAVFATFVRFDHWATRAIWAVISIAHRNLAGIIVDQAARRPRAVRPRQPDGDPDVQNIHHG